MQILALAQYARWTLFFFHFFFIYESWMHQTDQYHVNNNYIQPHTWVCVFFATHFNNETKKNSNPFEFVHICFDFFFIFRFPHNWILDKKRFIQLNFFFVNMLKKKVISILYVHHWLRDIDRAREKIKTIFRHKVINDRIIWSICELILSSIFEIQNAFYRKLKIFQRNHQRRY